MGFGGLPQSGGAGEAPWSGSPVPSAAPSCLEVTSAFFCVTPTLWKLLWSEALHLKLGDPQLCLALGLTRCKPESCLAPRASPCVKAALRWNREGGWVQGCEAHWK